MKVTELRIGNYVEGIGMEDPIRRINDSIQYNYNTEKYELDAIDFQYFKPIQLTEEWLEKFGFKITGQTPHPNNIWTVYGEECKFELEHIISFFLYDNKCFGTEVKYVHQLQNLYFALTGEELTLK